MVEAVFLDRDGTINEEAGDFCSPDKLVFIPGSIEALRILQEEFALFIITNQSGIGKSVFSEEEFLRFNEYFKSVLKKEGIAIQKLYYCPHTRKDNCVCHKPSPYFMKAAEREFGISLEESYVIGDHPSDVEMAHCVSAAGVYVLTGHGKKHRNELSVKPDFVARNLFTGAQWMLIH